MRRNPRAGDAAIISRLVDLGIDDSYAAQLAIFVPVAYCRLLLKETGVRFSNSFCRVLPDGSISSEQPLASEPIWNGALDFARREIARGMQAGDLLSIAGRSPEFEAANNLLQRGAHLEDIALTSLVVKTA